MSMATLSHSNTLPSRGHFANITSGNVMEKIHSVLTERECSIFDKGLSAYHKRKDVSGLVESLSLVLNTNPKRQLLVPIRDAFIKPSDLIKFNDLAIKYGLALPVRGTATTKKVHNRSQAGPKVIEVRRDEKGEWGFSVRGGVDHGIGIFVSWVDRDSNADKAGLKIGDYVHRVNEMGLDGLTYAQATQVFRNHSKISMVVTSYGKIPGFQFANKLFRWVDREGKPAMPPTELESLGMTAGGHVDPTLRKVALTVESGQELGISIRGGAEHGLAIYVSGVDPGSVAEANGIQIGEQILEVNGISYINILHPDAAKGLKEQRTMVMRLKDIGKLPKAKIQPPVMSQQWRREPSLASQPRSLTGTAKRSHHDDEAVISKPARHHKPPSVASTAEGASVNQPPVMLKRTISPARGIMNEIAQTLLTKPEMTSFTYYITRYEHNQIGVEALVESLLKLLNTNKKMPLLGEVRNIIREQDLDLFNELTLQREIEAFRANNRRGSYSGSDDEIPVHAMNGARPPPRGFEERDGDDDSLDDVPQRVSPKETVPIIFHPPPPPPARGGPQKTSTPEQQHLIAETMRDRRLKLHESVLEDDSWEDTLPRPPPHSTRELEENVKKELEAKLKQEFDQERHKILEAKLEAEKEALEAKLAAEKERQQIQTLEDQKRQILQEREAMEQQIKELQEQPHQSQGPPVDKEKLEEDIWRQAEDSLRQELSDQIEKESREKLKREYDQKLESSLAEERRKTDAERRRREELERKQREKNVVEREKEEQLRIDMENRLRKEAEERARQEYDERLQRESEEKARLAEEINSYRTMKSEMESERQERNRLEQAKREAERKAEQEAAEKERIEAQLRKEKQEAEEKAQREAAEKERLEELLREKQRELEEKERQEQVIRETMPKTEALEEEESDDEEERRRLDEEERQRLEEEEEELRRQEEEEERQEEERRRKEEEAKKKKQQEKKAKQDEEKRRRQQERELARKAEEERLRRLREAEEKRQKEEEEEEEQDGEEARQREEEEKRLRKEERRVSKEGSFFDPAIMDDIVLDVGSVVMPSAPPARGTGHVTFEDQRLKEQKIIEKERKLAEQMLAVRLRDKKKDKKEEGRFSFGGYSNLKGKLSKVTVTKVNKKLGIAVDGGANTKQKAVIVRQIVPDGSAAMTGKGLEIGQQLLTVNGKSLKGLKHKEAVLAIKNAFDGPLQKMIEFDVLTPDN